MRFIIYKLFLLMYLNYFSTLKIETIQIINNSGAKTPLKVFIFFFKDFNGFQQMKEKNNNDLIEVIKDIGYFYYFNRNYLLLKPIKIELVEGEISKKIVLHNSEGNLLGIFIFFITFDGNFQKTFLIPGDSEGNKNMLLVLEDGKIIIRNGIFSKNDMNNIINNIKKSSN